MSAKVVDIGKPEYPRECLQKGHEGKVVVEITIKADGSNGGTTVIESSGCNYMDGSALNFLNKCTLAPKKIMGVPVDSKKKIAFRFNITMADNENTQDN
ncbi:MAG: energy transducer TonB [Candidatus Brocadia sp.]